MRTELTTTSWPGLFVAGAAGDEEDEDVLWEALC